MQGAEHQVTGFRRRQGQADGFQVPQLADQDNVRVFPQCGAQGFVEAQGVTMHFPLVQQALLGFVYEFDGVLDGEDVLIAAVVDVVDHRRQGGGLTGACWARNQHQTSWHRGDVLEHLPHTEVFHRQYL